jgi:hypothetical protein
MLQEQAAKGGEPYGASMEAEDQLKKDEGKAVELKITCCANRWLALNEECGMPLGYWQ